VRWERTESKVPAEAAKDLEACLLAIAAADGLEDPVKTQDRVFRTEPSTAKGHVDVWRETMGATYKKFIDRTDTSGTG
jgi:hypothetical protein